jgi:hypothetical protein
VPAKLRRPWGCAKEDRVRVAERVDAQNDEDTIEHELAAWRHEIRLHALAQLACKPAKPPRSVRIGVLVSLLLLLAGSLIGLRHAMQPKIPPRETAIEIVLIDESQPAPSPGRSPSAPKAMDGREGPKVAAHPTAQRVEPPSTAVQTTSTTSEPASPVYRVFNPDGSVIIPPVGANQGMQASFVPQSTQASPIMRHQRPLKVRPNHFAQNWQAPPDETLLGAFVREHLTADTQFMTPWGTLVKCGVIVLVAGCAWGPPPVWQPTQTWRPATALDEE